LLLRKKSKAIVRISGTNYTPIEAARHYCGSECLTRRGVLRDYERWLKAGINGKNF